MKSIKQHIKEALKINSKSKVIRKQPIKVKTSDELCNVIKEKITYQFCLICTLLSC